MNLAPEDRVPWRVQAAVYASGLFSNSSFHLYNLVVPLWLATLEPSPFIIGVVLGSRQFLTVILSIHGGALMDRLGTRRVMLYCAAAAMVSPLLYPAMPWIPALIVLQMVGGLAVMTCWIGAQALVGQVMRGHPTYAGRLSFFTKVGVFLGPPAVGAIWDFAGPWGAFTALGFWGGGVLVCTLLLPAAAAEPAGPDVAVVRSAGRPPLRAFMPKIGDYVAAFSLLSIPAIALVIAATVMRHAGVSIQGSFYVVYLGEIGISGTAIGVLLSVTGICGAGGSLLAGVATRIMRSYRVMLAAVALSVVMLAITPLLTTYVLLVVAIGVRGVGNGLSQALEISMMARSADPSAQGKAAALRITAGRLSAFVLPILMGAVVELTGLEYGFYIMGGAILMVLAAAAVAFRRAGG